MRVSEIRVKQIRVNQGLGVSILTGSTFDGFIDCTHILTIRDNVRFFLLPYEL